MTDAPVGLQNLGLASASDAVAFVPAGYRADHPLPLVLMLHGAGGNARGGLDPLLAQAETANVILLAPQSRDRTWDGVLGEFGADVAFVDRALDVVTERYAIDGARVAVGGFSDGASYALGLGLANGDLFSHVAAFSPGFTPSAPAVGQPRVFISHGVFDKVLPIQRCSRRIVPALRREGYEVDYREFDGGHEVPPAMVDAALAWFSEGR